MLKKGLGFNKKSKVGISCIARSNEQTMENNAHDQTLSLTLDRVFTWMKDGILEPLEIEVLVARGTITSLEGSMSLDNL